MRTLRLYVHDGCPSCAFAREILARIAERFSVATRVIDLGHCSTCPPEGVFAVPTLTLDGRVISLGTPSWDAMVHQLSCDDEGDEP